MSGLGYRKDVEFLEECNPALVERNAAEFRRLRDLLVQVEEPARRAQTRTQWQSDGSHTYTGRLAEARQLVTHMAEGYDKAASALNAYAAALTTAKSHYRDGKRSEGALAALIGTKGTAITRTAQMAEPMRQWEDMRATTGVFDWLAEATMDVDDIRDEANGLHDAAGGSFHLAKTAEQEARSTCVHALRQAYELLPEFTVRGGGGIDVYAAMADIRREAAEARTSPLTHLPGSGPKRQLTEPVGKAEVSPELKDIRMRVASLPMPDDGYWSAPDGDGEKAEWISRNKELLRAAAQHAGLPEEMVAGIAWKEISGQPGFVDDGVDTVREWAASDMSPITPENLFSRAGGAPDETSFGPIAIQVRRGAEVLGYDPAHLTEDQRDVVEESLQDPKQNAFIAANFLAQIKAEAGYGNIPAGELTDAQMREIAARYNGGPYWQSDKAQNYGNDFGDSLPTVKDAMR
ncbi:hypothetical protein AMK16_12050 [Streptomyces sp. CB00455]|uniref:hypothetical protein n=1 Tax=Streptomyces sp. CB00455 TaxID=1703927 RepID=UPI00093AAC1C|nr:hypothetical protein [Streptomyces sp. CB00455]OKK21089.1 hypothetical protein AMK16_12050 [Streptomyces sp. CB00455]